MLTHQKRRPNAECGGEVAPPADFETQEIILIESDRDHGVLIRQALRKVLPEKTITVFHRGAAAAAHIKRVASGNMLCNRHDIELVLIDLHLPTVDGLAILRMIKSDPAASRIPVVLLSAAEGAADIERAMEMGADEFVIKPFGFREFTRTIQRIATTWCTGWRA